MSPLTPSCQPETEPQKPKLLDLPVKKCLCRLEEDLARLGEYEIPSPNFVLIFSTACFLCKSTFSVRKAMWQDVGELEEVKERLNAVYHHPAFQRLKVDPSSMGSVMDLRFIIGFFEGKNN